MVGRTVVIGDIPWVAQAAEAFLSKIFACSYSIAGLNVLSANPSDHLVHRHTHRVVRGTLLVCGRPDGRLAALSSAEASVCLSVNQASSIQSIGGTCESVTIGHNPFKLPLSARAIFLGRHRPQFLCEKILGEVDIEEEKARRQLLLTAAASDPKCSEENKNGRNGNELVRRWSSCSLRSNVSNGSLFGLQSSHGKRRHILRRQSSGGTTSTKESASGESHGSTSNLYSKISFVLGHAPKNKRSKGKSRRSMSRQNSHNSCPSDDGTFEDAFFSEGEPPDGNCRPSLKNRSSTALLGAYIDLEKRSHMMENKVPSSKRQPLSVDKMVYTAIQDKKTHDTVRELFDAIDVNGNSTLAKEEFVVGYSKLNPDLSKHHIEKIFEESDVGENGCLDFEDFSRVIKMTPVEIVAMLQAKNRDERGLIQVEPSKEEYFGEKIRKGLSTNYNFSATRSQYFSQELYETRIASLQRFVAMTVMFHRMGKRVQEFFPRISCGWLGYRMDRTHSIMRIATTASPVSGADVRERMQMLHLLNQINRSVHIISVAWLKYKEQKKKNEMNKLLEHYNSFRKESGNTPPPPAVIVHEEEIQISPTPLHTKAQITMRRHSCHR
uniref:EF-hand domain-containing protein n=1 Tax=Ditylum brightwellii TaxID=49249 RepID=A0A7S1VZX5_9STRA|mmetsp:Transcript_11903/g.17727  ORF Transcript_11903/g.17727 Transcript_11903/m.17727 type:complete len:608 (+) Transcript_11903:3-1826(+)